MPGTGTTGAWVAGSVGACVAGSVGACVAGSNWPCLTAGSTGRTVGMLIVGRTMTAALAAETPRAATDVATRAAETRRVKRVMVSLREKIGRRSRPVTLQDGRACFFAETAAR